MNQTVLVGRLSSTPQIRELENGKKACIVKLAVDRSYKNEEGVYETDLISCLIQGNMAVNTCEYCRQGDTLGIKCRLEVNNTLIVVADKVTFLATNDRVRQDLESEED